MTRAKFRIGPADPGMPCEFDTSVAERLAPMGGVDVDDDDDDGDEPDELELYRLRREAKYGS